MNTQSPTGKVILAGGSGFLGTALTQSLREKFADVVVLTRSAGREETGVRFVQWDAKTSGPWECEMNGATAIVNFVGRTVDCRKTPANKKVILESRVESVRALASAIAKCDSPPNVWVQASTAHIFGDTHDEIIDESSPIGTGFAPDVGVAWEKAFNESQIGPCRRVILRTSFVLGRHGGALGTLARLTKLFLGGTVGNGKQYISWIHIDDFNAIVLRALEDSSMHGIYIVTAPEPVTNEHFMRTLRKTLLRPWSPPAPEIAVRIASVFMRTDPQLALLGRRAVPTRLLNEGFQFRFPQLNPALNDLLRS